MTPIIFQNASLPPPPVTRPPPLPVSGPLLPSGPPACVIGGPGMVTIRFKLSAFSMQRRQ